MIDSVCIVGAGRVGAAFASRLREGGLAVSVTGRELALAAADVVLLCVPDAAIAEVACRIAPGPWLAHPSGATPLEALDPHTRRFSLHPLQTIVRSGDPKQLDGAWAAVAAETDDARAVALELAALLGLEPFMLADGERALYHAGAAVASNFLVTLHAAAVRLVDAAGAPPEALLPLMRRTMENGFELTGPIQRGDWSTVGAHLAAIHERLPELEPAYRALAELTAVLGGPPRTATKPERTLVVNGAGSSLVELSRAAGRVA